MRMIIAVGFREEKSYVFTQVLLITYTVCTTNTVQIASAILLFTHTLLSLNALTSPFLGGRGVKSQKLQLGLVWLSRGKGILKLLHNF